MLRQQKKYRDEKHADLDNLEKQRSKKKSDRLSKIIRRRHREKYLLNEKIEFNDLKDSVPKSFKGLKNPLTP